MPITDPPPLKGRKAERFAASTKTKTLPLPRAGRCDRHLAAYRDAHAEKDMGGIEQALNALAQQLAKFHRLPFPPTIKLKGVRPHSYKGGRLAYQQLGECHISGRITIWAQTAHRKQLATFRRILATFVHEYCHYLDFWHFHFIESPHTVGFYERIDRLYNRLLRQRRQPLIWGDLGDGRWMMYFAQPGRKKVR